MHGKPLTFQEEQELRALQSRSLRLLSWDERAREHDLVMRHNASAGMIVDVLCPPLTKVVCGICGATTVRAECIEHRENAGSGIDS